MKIAGITATTMAIPSSWRAFELQSAMESADLEIKCSGSGKLPIAPENRQRRIDWETVLHPLEVESLSDGDWWIHNAVSSTALSICCTPDYRKITICCSNDMQMQKEEAFNLLRVPFECRFCHESIVSFHAACVEVDGYAVCFTGDSGVGKSTRAQAWVQGLGARFISGDRPAIRLETDGCTVCGVPWDGKEQIFRNVERPLTAIFEVRRAPFTRLRRLTVDQAYGVLMRQSFIPMWDTDTAALAMVNVRRLSRSVPVYRLFCGPSAEDARVVYEILMNHPEEIREEKDDMKIRNGFVLRNVVDEYMVMPTGENIEKYDGAVVMNAVSAFVFQQLENGISRDDLLTAIVNEFDVDEATAAADLDELLAQFGKMGLLED